MRPVHLPAVLAAAMMTTAVCHPEARASEQGRWTPTVLAAGEPYLPDWSTVGYRWGAHPPDPLAEGRVVVEAVDHGVKPGDDADDTDALRRAVAAAEAVDGPVTLRLPPGRVILREILFLERSDFVLLGAGAGEGGSELHIPRPMGEMQLPPSMQRTRRSLIERDKRVGGELFSVFAWTGGVLWVRKPDGAGPTVGRAVATPVAGRRGGHTLRLDAAGDIALGQALELSWRNPEGRDGSLLRHVFAAEVPVGQRLYEDPDRPIVRQHLTVTAVAGQTIRVREPLLHDVKPAWAPRLRATAHLTEVGIDGLRITFPKTAYGGHFREAGYNAIYFTDTAHGWVRGVTVEHADSGIMVGGGHHVTLRDIAILGRGGHYSVKFGGGSGYLCRGFRIEAPALHNPSFNTGCNSSVFTGGTVHAARFDQHCGANHQNLFDRITAVYDSPRDARDFFRHGGAGYWRPTAGAFNTFWNIAVRVEAPGGDATADLGGVTDAPHARLIGIHGNVPLKLNYGPAAHIEGLNRPGTHPASLYEHQQKAAGARP